MPGESSLPVSAAFVFPAAVSSVAGLFLLPLVLARHAAWFVMEGVSTLPARWLEEAAFVFQAALALQGQPQPVPLSLLLHPA